MNWRQRWSKQTDFYNSCHRTDNAGHFDRQWIEVWQQYPIIALIAMPHTSTLQARKCHFYTSCGKQGRATPGDGARVAAPVLGGYAISAELDNYYVSIYIYRLHVNIHLLYVNIYYGIQAEWQRGARLVQRYCGMGTETAEWLERRTRDRKASGSSPLKSGGKIFLFRGQLSMLTLIQVCVPPPWYCSIM